MNNLLSKVWRRLVVAALIALPVSLAQAGMISTDQALSADKIRSDRDKIHQFLDRSDVQRKLQALGVQADLAKKRVDGLTDQEVETIAGDLDSLPAAGALDRYDIVIILLVVIILIIAI